MASFPGQPERLNLSGF